MRQTADTDSNLELTRHYYRSYDVENRIKQDKAHYIEFLITMDLLNELLAGIDASQAIVADIGCGPGIYSVEIAPHLRKLYACDLMPNLLETLIKKAEKLGIDNIVPFCTNAEQLSMIEENTCDVVMCMGPLYHLSNPISRANCLNECKRIVKPDGKIVLTYLNPRASFANIKRGKMTVREFELAEGQEQILLPPFLFTSPHYMEEELKKQGYTIERHIALDAFSSFMLEEINSWDDDAYESWLRIVRRYKEDPSWLVFSSHGLIVSGVNK